MRSHISEGKDFFLYEPDNYDVIVSNPPFSLKDNILKRLDELGKPFAILLPLSSLQGKRRYQYLKDIQILAFDERIDFHTVESMDKTKKGMCFTTCYFCKGVLPKSLILEHLEKYDKPLGQM